MNNYPQAAGVSVQNKNKCGSDGDSAAAPFLQGVKVKALAWELASGDHYAEGAGTHYNIYETRPDFWNCVTVKPGNVRLATNVCLDEAKSAAQADYEARILSALEPSDLDMGNPITLTYTNYRGETSERTLTPIRSWFGSTEWHPEPQWLLRAYDHDKGAERDFALKDFGRQKPAAARELALEEAAQVAGNFLMLKTGLPVDKIVELEAALRALSSQPVADGVDSIEATRQDDGLTACFRHHVKTSIGWQAFGARTGKERQMYEEGFKAGYRRCKSDNEPELGEDEYISQRARMIVGRLRESIKAGAVNLSDVEDAADLILDQDTRASHPVVERLPQDVINLVIAAREFWEDHYSDLPSSHVLDEALEAFSNSVLCKNEPAALPASPEVSG